MSLRDKSITGVKWTGISKVSLAIVGILKIAVLARFLNPADFGLMALVTFVLGFMGIFMNMGLSTAILHKQNITDKEYASLYWINVFFSLGIFIFLIVISPLLSSIYEESELQILIPLAAVKIIFSSIGLQFKTIEQKEMNFKFIAFTDITGAVFGTVLGIILAIQGFGVYSLIFAVLLQYLIANLIYLFNGLFKKGMLFHCNYTETKPFLSIGLYQVGSQIVNYFNRDFDIILIGKFFGSEVLGGYSLAKQLVQKPMTIINPIITHVASPALALLQTEKTRMKYSFLKLLKIVSTINITAYGILAVFAYPIVWLFYGSEYLHIVIIVQILSAYMYLRSVGNPVGSLVVATGRTDLEFYWNTFVLFFAPIAIIIGSYFSIKAVAISLVLLQVFLKIPAWKFLIKKLVNIGMLEYFKCYIPSFSLIKNYLLKI